MVEKMTRRPLNLLTVLSLLLWAAVVAMWVRSYRVGDLWMHVTHVGNGFREWSLASSSGRFGWHATDWQYMGENAGRGWAADRFNGSLRQGLTPGTTRPWRLSPWETLGFHTSNTSEQHRPSDPVTDEHYRRRVTTRVVNVPYYAPALLTAVTPAWWVLSRRGVRRRRRLARGLCAHCGYDLRASPERCPECGTVAGKANPT
jgi:hypothetical protein